MFARLLVYGRQLSSGLLPEHCTLCGEPAPGALLCAACTADLPGNTPACPGCALPSPSGLALPCPACQAKPRVFDAAFAPFVLASPVREGIHGLKYRARFAQAELLGRAFAERWRQAARPAPHWLVPVPLHWRRQWWRGHNQSLLLARVIGRELGLPVHATATTRQRPTADQIGQTAAQRRQNLKGAFTAHPRMAGRQVALLDDVMTTGATLEALARACKAAGAARVEAWAVARQPLERG